MADAYLPSRAARPFPGHTRTSPQTERASTKEAAAELVAALMWRPQTRNGLADVTGLSCATVDRWLSSFRRSGVVHLSGFDHSTGCGRPARLWALQPKPFAMPDAELPSTTA